MSENRTAGALVGLQSSSRIWSGLRPSILYGSPSACLSLSLRPMPDSPTDLARGAGVRSVTVKAVITQEGWGGRQTRVFQVGEGLAANLHVPGTDTINATIVGDKVPDGMSLYWAWSDTPPRTSEVLINAFAYPVANARFALPEGVTSVVFDAAGTITWTMTSLGLTFAQPVTAGQPVEALWGTFTFDQNNANVVAILRPF